MDKAFKQKETRIMEQPVKPILFASDLTPEMKQVFRYAVIQALGWKTSIIILHVMEAHSHAEGQISLWFGKEEYQNLKTSLKHEARKTLTGKDISGHRIRKAIAGFFDEQEPDKDGPSLIKDILVKEGRSIADEITLTAMEEDCAMIVTGCRKQGLIASAMGDHVVRKILKKSPVPVLVIPYSGE